jgi:hypothetical protein
MKPGLSTTEYWMTLAAVVLAAAQPMVVQETWARVVAVALAVLATLGYTAARAASKAVSEAIAAQTERHAAELRAIQSGGERSASDVSGS